MKQPTTGSFELIKSLNTACIINSIRISGQISRADIARGTGLTPATVSNITAEIMELGLIKEMERGESNGGRKPVLLSINKTACYFGAIHIGSTMVETAVADVSANLIARTSAPIGLGVSPEETVTMGLQLLKATRREAGVKTFAGIGICTHGLVRSSEGMMVFAPNLGWSNVRIGGMVATATGLPVFVENDVRAMALAESWCGFARGVKDYVYLYVGSGIGGSIIYGNELYKGPCGFAGEFGHVTIDPEGPLCSCGNRGCLQALASETAVLNQYIERKKLHGEIVPENFDFAAVLRAAKFGNDVAREEILKSVRYIGIEVGNIINTLSPSLIVINGRLTEFSEVVMPTLCKEIGRHCMRDSQDSAKIAFSTLGEEAPILGAATCVIRQMFESPKTFLKVSQKQSTME